MDAARWNKMSVSEQILNIGGEVQRAVAKKEKADDEGARKYLQLALDWIELTKADPKNKNRMDEISTAEDELIDYFGENNWNNDSKTIMGYWDSFLSAIF